MYVEKGNHGLLQLRYDTPNNLCSSLSNPVLSDLLEGNVVKVYDQGVSFQLQKKKERSGVYPKK